MRVSVSKQILQQSVEFGVLAQFAHRRGGTLSTSVDEVQQTSTVWR